MIALEPFLSDVQELGRRAREQIERGPPTPTYQGGVKQICDILNQVLATELLCVLRYRRHYFSAKAVNKESAAREFLQHAGEEQLHADRIAECITELGGKPNFNPDGLSTHGDFNSVDDTDLVDAIKENLAAERVAIQTYNDVIAFIAHKDPTTRRILEDILAVEEEHADDMRDVIQQLLAGGACRAEPTV